MIGISVVLSSFHLYVDRAKSSPVRAECPDNDKTVFPLTGWSGYRPYSYKTSVERTIVVVFLDSQNYNVL